jgi:hypothetical protein
MPRGPSKTILKEVKCAECRQKFTPMTTWQRFCSIQHRNDFHNRTTVHKLAEKRAKEKKSA